MTNEEAKERIQALYNDWLPVEYDFEVFDTEENKLDREAFALAIEALKAKSEIENSKSEIKNAKTEISMSKSKMTNEEAIAILKREFSECKDTISVYARKRKKAFDMAIKALEQTDVLDKIRAEIESQRKEVSNKNSENDKLQAYYHGLNDGLKDARDILDKYKAASEDKGEISDGYHTFNQLYHQRAILFATIVNQNKNKAWKSFKHSDGKYCFDSDGEWFIVGVDTPQGSYTYHYSKEYWDMFDCQELECGKEWDGHTEEDVTRLLSLEQQQNRCDSCTHYEEQDGSNCYECVKGMADNFEAQPTDAISREEALLALTGMDLPTDRDKLIALFTNRIQHLPSVTPRTNLAETSQDCISILNRIMEYTYGMLTTEKIGLQHLIKSMMDEMSGGDSE